MQHQGRRRLPEVGIVDQVGMQAGEEPRHLIKVMQGHDGPSLGHEPQPDEVSREGPFEKRPALVPAAFVRAIGMHAVRKQPEEDRPGESQAAAGRGIQPALPALYQHDGETRQFPVRHRTAGLLPAAAGNSKSAGSGKRRPIDGLWVSHGERKVQL